MNLSSQKSAIALSASAAALLMPVSAFAEDGAAGADILIPKMAEFIPALIAFLIIWIVLAKVALPGIMKTMEERGKKIEESLDEAEKTKQEAIAKRAESDSIVTDARRQAADIVLEARKDAESERARIIEAAHKEAEEIIASGKADMVAMARQLMCDPMTLRNAYCGRENDTRPCLRCHECAPADIVHLRCATNPMLGREFEPGEIRPSTSPKKVIVVGGGVAGCMAAKTLVQRGHDVTLIEKGDKLGGKLHEISCLSFKFDMRRHLDWLMRSTMKCGAEILLNTEATVESIMAMEPDAVFVATGSDRLMPPIPGIDRANVHHVLDVDTGRVSVGGTVVVCGGGLSGMESALELSNEGKKVTVVDMIPVEEFARDHSPSPRGMLLQLLERNGVKLIGSSRVTAFTDEGVVIEDHNWHKTVLPCDDVVAAFGMRKNDALLNALREVMPEVYAVGDCNEVKNIKNANQIAFNLALDL